MRRRMFYLALGTLLLLPVMSSAIAGMDERIDVIQPTDEIDVMFESFESGWPPAGWIRFQTGDPLAWAWNRVSTIQHSGVYSARCGHGTMVERDNWLVTYGIDLSGQVGPYMEWYEQSDNWVSAGEAHYIMVSTTSQSDPAEFSVLMEMTPANHTPDGFDGDPVVIDLSAYAGEPVVYIAFRYVGGSNEVWYVDDMRIFQPGLEHDVLPQSIIPSLQNFSDGQPIMPQALISNVGQNAESFDVMMEIEATGTLVYSEITSVTSLSIGQSQWVSFPTFNVEAGHLYTLRATTMLVGDLNPNNDSFETYIFTYTQQRVPMGILFTNSGCGPCVSVNQALDAYMPTQGNEFALMRVHVNWPNPNDIMYLANTAQNNHLISLYGVSGVPSYFMDGQSSAFTPSNVEARKQVPTASTISFQWDSENENLTVIVDNVEPLPPIEELRLFTVITEDGIVHNGGNGEPIHNQAFRFMYPDVNGLPIDPSLGQHQYVLNCPLDAGWVYDNLRATAYIQDTATFDIVQGGTAFLTEIEGTVDVGDQVVERYQLASNYPNPFNPSTTIKFSIPRNQEVTLNIYALDGSRVATLVHDVLQAGDHQVIWDGRNSQGGQVASGSYFYRLDAGDFTETKRMVLVK